MLLNYLKLSFRLLARNPFFTFINVLGLAIGFTSFYALWEYATTELNSDQYHQDAERIARIAVDWQWTDDGGKTWGTIVVGLSKPSIFPRVKDDFPDVESYLRILNQPGFNPALVNHGNQIIISTSDDAKNQRGVFKEKKAIYADSNLFTFFSIPLIYGQPSQVLREANYVVLSRSTAIKYFGERNPTGELLKLNDTTTLKVTGVYKDLPHYTHLDFDLVISNVGLQNQWSNYQEFGPVCYIKLNHQNFQDFNTALDERTSQYWASNLRNYPQARLNMIVQPLPEISFTRNFVGDTFHSKSKPFLYTLAFIALSVLVMAWINYVNLSVTRTTRRLKEVATRKVSGAGARDMIRQFVTESVVTNLLAIALALTLVQTIRKPVSLLFNIQIAPFSSLESSSAVIFLAIIFSGILLSGLYPAIISMAHQPRALFTISTKSSSRRLIPSVLSVSQITVAIIFILLGFVVSLQLNHVLNLDTGISKEQVLVIEAPVIKPLNYSTILASLKKQTLALPNVESAALSDHVYSHGYEGGTHLKRIGAELFFGMDGNRVDSDFIQLYGIKLIAGRNFIKNEQPGRILISRFATTRLGFASADEAVGTIVNEAPPSGELQWKEAEVIGVFEDFRVVPFLNMSESSTEYSNQGRGIVLKYEDELLGTPEKISLRISPNGFEATIQALQSLFEQQFPGNVFTWYFLNDEINQAYHNEKVARNQIVLFTALALFIACLGLLGMITNKAVEKTKEIGIRKVLGAEPHQIAKILLDTTLKQVILATFIGIPVAYYLAQLYLEKFSEQINLQWWHFAIPVVILILIMLSTISSVMWRAARTNPVNALKCD